MATPPPPPEPRAAIFLRVSRSRLIESRWTIALPLLALLYWLVTCGLEVAIYCDNVLEFEAIRIMDNDTFGEASWLATINASRTIRAGDDPLARAGLNFQTRALQTIFFIIFVFMMFIFAVDAILRQNSIQLFAYLAVQVLCLAFTSSQIYDAVLWYRNLDYFREAYGIDLPIYRLVYQRNYATAELAFGLVFAGASAFVVWRLYQQFGWNIYRRIGADLTIQTMYRQYQLFLVFLKLSPLFQICFEAVFLGILVQSNFMGINLGKSIFHIVITALNLLAFATIGTAARREMRWPLIAYIVLNVGIAVNFGLIFSVFNTSTNWGILMACGIIDSFLNIGYTVVVMRNFGKGLKDNIRILGEDKPGNEDMDFAGWAIDDGFSDPEHRDGARPEGTNNEEWDIERHGSSSVPLQHVGGNIEQRGGPPVPPPHLVPIAGIVDGSEKHEVPEEEWDGIDLGER